MAKVRKRTKRIIPNHVDDDQEHPSTVPLPYNDVEDNTLQIALNIGTNGSILKRLTCINELLSDRESLIKVATLTAGGASIDTVEMSLGLPPGMLKAWLKNGKHDVEGPFREFYQFYLLASAEAKLAAESSLLVKNPAAWLDRIDPYTQLNSLEEGDAIQIAKVESSDKTITSHSGVQFKDFDET